MEQRKIIFLDVDGTLVDYSGHIPQSAAEAVRLARQKGHKVYICTGRSRAEVYPEIWEIGLDGMIGGNGSYVEDGGQVILHRHLSAFQCRQIVDWLHSRKLEFYLECNAGLFGSEQFKTEAEPVIQIYGRRKDGSGSLTVKEAFPDMIFGAELYRDDVNKISFILKSYEDYLDAAEAFPELKAGTWGGAGETALFGDLALKEIDKAYAMDVLLEHLHASPDATVAFGDAKVDIPMLEHSRIGVAMGNGGPEIRAAADYVTDDVECDGLWKAFSHLGLLE